MYPVFFETQIITCILIRYITVVLPGETLAPLADPSPLHLMFLRIPYVSLNAPFAVSERREKYIYAYTF